MSGSKSSVTGWQLLHSDVPKEAIKPLSASVYGVSGLSDVNEAYLIERLHQSELAWSWTLEETAYIGKEARKGQNGTYEVFMASARGTLAIEDEKGSGRFRLYAGVGASDNKKLDAAFKGANTVAFKAACKPAGLTLSVYKDGKSVDILYTNADGSTSTGIENDDRASVEPPGAQEAPAVAASKSPLTPAQNKTLGYLLNQLPSVAEQIKLGTPELGAWNKARVADGVRTYEARKAGSGFLGAYNALVKAHGAECGASCEHVNHALQSDGYRETIAAAPGVVAA